MLNKFKYAIKTKAGITLCTNALKISLINKEEKIASVLLVEYKVKTEEDMITRALATQKFEFLRNMWLFKKNYIEYSEEKKKYFSFDYLFKRIIHIWEDKSKERIDEVTGWKIRPDDENMLLSLLK